VYKKGLIVMLALLLSLAAFATEQHPKNKTAEAAYYIHLDKSFYVNGEVIWYKMTMPADPQHQSAAIKVVLTDKNGQSLFDTFLKNRESASVSGYYKIPFDLPGGMYRINFLATEAGTGKRINLAYADLPIYNDSEPISSPAPGSGVGRPADGTGLNDLKVEILFSKDTLRSRSEMETTIRVTDADGRPVEANVSLAVSDQALTGSRGTPTITIIPGLPAPLTQKLDTSITVKARLTDYRGQPLTANVLGVLMPEHKRIYYTRTSAPGEVNLRLPDFYDRQAIQFLGFPDEEDSIRVALLADEQLAAEGTLTYTPEILKYLELSRKRKKIFQLYTDLEFNLQPEVPGIEPQTLEPERTVNVKDYEAFDNVYLFFKEILTPLVFREVDDEVMEAKVFTDKGNRVYEMLSGAPLFLIDGQATRDGNYVAHMKMDMVETVSIFTDRSDLRRQFNVLGRSGVVIIETSSADITVPETDADDIKLVNGLQAPADFPAYSPEQFQSDRHRPFFRPQLFWDPDLQTDPSGQVSTAFYQSDAAGNFQLRVMVKDKLGRVGYAEKTYFAVW
jgi:hypothetical protein